jgi:hypothetical protein
LRNSSLGLHAYLIQTVGIVSLQENQYLLNHSSLYGILYDEDIVSFLDLRFIDEVGDEDDDWDLD